MHLRAYHACRKNRACAVSGGFSGGLLPVLPSLRQKRPEAVLAVRTIMALC